MSLKLTWMLLNFHICLLDPTSGHELDKDDFYLTYEEMPSWRAATSGGINGHVGLDKLYRMLSITTNSGSIDFLTISLSKKRALYAAADGR
ncbi:unnamed protein product [Heligmosomoides polygyrus]|uniref:Secreted protein n=1 Tax=Heligmosomoides polygyrus TaxID=6339 RepID=A0A183FSI7_HELPZ|nr:unnamed protein product [Heligmosomoides polygyrus]